MITEEKNLLLKDLCSRLPYKPIIKCKIINLREEQYAKDNHPSHIVHPTYEGNGYLYSVNILSQSVGIRPILKHLEYKEQVYFEKICNDGYINIEEVKPYLRPMSSMTEEEKKEYIEYAGYEIEESVNGRHYEYYLKDFCGTPDNPSVNTNGVDWLNKKMFDFRGLIPASLALSTDVFNPYKD